MSEYGALFGRARKFASVPVLYVLGNHEYYGHAYPRLLGEMHDEAKGSSV